MKNGLMFLVTILVFSAHAEIRSSEDDLFHQRDIENSGKSSEEIYKESIVNYNNFVKMDVDELASSSVAAIDSGKYSALSLKEAKIVLEAANSNPVVSLYSAKKNYDPKNSGIGFCFGRATFVNLYLALSGFNRAHIKKAFIVGPMSKGAWGWHVTTIVESRDSSNREIWLTIDPVAGKIMEVREWYEHWRDTASDDKKLRLYIANSGKFGPGAYSMYDENSFHDPFYNQYFDDMREWLETKFKKSNQLSF